MSSFNHHITTYEQRAAAAVLFSTFLLKNFGSILDRSCGQSYEGEGAIPDLTSGLSAAATVIQKRDIPSLSYKYDDEFPDAAKPPMLRAFESWEEPMNITFSLSEGEADIVIGMYDGDHDDERPFKAGPGGELAHATVPPHGEVHFNSEQPWWYELVPPPAGGDPFFDFQSVAAHEIGHILGIEHIDDPKAVMYKSIDPGEIRRGLTNSDVAALEFIYSGDPNFD